MKSRQPVGNSAPRWQLLLAGLAHAGLMLMAFPPIAIWPAALVAIIPLIWAGCHAGPRPMRRGIWAAIGAMPLQLIWHLWLIDVTAPGYPGIVVYLSMYPWLFVWLVGLARRVDWPIPMAVVAAMAWTGLEVLRSDVVLTGYGFFLLGHPLIDNTALALPGTLLGAGLVSLLAAAMGGAIADAGGWGGLSRRVGGVSACVVVVCWMFLCWLGEVTSAAGPSFELRVGAVQTNVPQSNKMRWDINQKIRDSRRFAEITRQLAAARPEPEIILWPETMFPGIALGPAELATERRAELTFQKADQALVMQGAPGGPSKADAPGSPAWTGAPSTIFADELLKLSKDTSASMLIGMTWREGLSIVSRDKGIETPSRRVYNSAVLVVAGQVSTQRYDKVDLTPMGEVVPYLWRWPSLQQAVLGFGAAGMTFDLSPGERVGSIEIPLPSPGLGRPVSVWAATPICFEASRAEICRKLVANSEAPARAGVIFNLSNDGWFGWFDPFRDMHLLAARWRSLELGVPMVRSVNTGISAGIDRRGRIIAPGPGQTLIGSPRPPAVPANPPAVTPGAGAVGGSAGSGSIGGSGSPTGAVKLNPGSSGRQAGGGVGGTGVAAGGGGGSDRRSTGDSGEDGWGLGGGMFGSPLARIDGGLAVAVPVALDPRPTIFARVGQMPMYLLTLATGVAAFVLVLRQRTLKRIGR